MLTTSARLLKLLSLLQARRFWSGAALAAELGVTERSVRRDVDRLRDLGYPVHAAGGVGGGYALGAGADLPPLPLDDDEAVAVALGLRAAAAGPVRGYEQAAIRALAKLEQVLPERLATPGVAARAGSALSRVRSSVRRSGAPEDGGPAAPPVAGRIQTRQLERPRRRGRPIWLRARLGALQAVSLRLDEGTPALDGVLLGAVAAACRDERTLAFAYQDRAGARTARAVEPYRLVHSTRRWYLVAWDLARRDWRTFRVDRMAEALPGGRFRPRELPAEDVAAWVAARTSAADAWQHAIRVRLRVDADSARARLGTAAGTVVPDGPGRCVFETSADDLDAAAGWLAVLGWELEVLSPPELRAALRRTAERLLRAADG